MYDALTAGAMDKLMDKGVGQQVRACAACLRAQSARQKGKQCPFWALTADAVAVLLSNCAPDASRCARLMCAQPLAAADVLACAACVALCSL